MSGFQVYKGKKEEQIIKANNIVPSKLKEARVSRNLSLSKLAEYIGVTAQNISLYEKGKIKPPAKVMVKYVEELEFPLSYFLEESNDSLNSNEITFFRSNKNIPKKIVEACNVKIKWVNRIKFT